MHVAIGAALFTAFTYTINNIHIQFNYLLFICTSTISLYSLHRVLGKNRRANYAYFEKINITIIHFRKYQLLSIIAGILSIYLFFTLSTLYQKWIIMPSILSFLYVLPIFNGNRLRDFPVVKIFLIAISWSWLCTYIPISDSDLSITSKILQCISSALFIYAITIPFDIRDFEIDKNENTITIPTKYGILNAIKSAKLALTIGAIILIPIIYQTHFSFKVFTIIATTLVLSIRLIINARPNSSEFYVSGLIEGLLLVPIITQVLWEYLFSIF